MKLTASLFILICSVAQISKAAVIYSTLGPGDSFEPSSAWGIGWGAGQEVAVPFTPANDHVFNSVKVAVAHQGDTNSYLVYLAAGATEPDVPIESFSGLTFPLSPGIVELNSTLFPHLTAGTQYWIVVTAPNIQTVGFWWYNSQADFSNVSFRDIYQSWQPYFSTTPALAVLGDPVPTPEPSSFGMTILAAGFVWAHRRRRRPRL